MFQTSPTSVSRLSLSRTAVAAAAAHRVRRRAESSIAMHRAVTMAADYVCERLEKRRLLSTTLIGGGDSGGVPQELSYEYLDGQQLDARISLLGNITATFTFAHVATSGAITLGNRVTPTAANVTAGAGSDLFHIEVTSASPDASISIARVALPTVADPGAPRPMQPFGSPGFTFTTQVAVIVGGAGATDGLANLSPDAGTGALLLGARQFTTPPGGGMLTQTGPLTEYQGVSAGLTVDPGVNMNRFFFGGTVIGRVDIGGSIDTFYAGQILTGDATGLVQGDSPDDTLLRNFNVTGDIANLISKGAIGTVTSASSGAPGVETYLTGFRLAVTGHVGEIQSGGNNVTSNFFGSAIVEDSSTFLGLGTTQHEEEGEVGTTTGDATAFEGSAAFDGVNAGVPSLAGSNANGGQATFNNDSASGAQLLGTLFSSKYGHGAVQLLGALDGENRVRDLDDYYGIALTGGQKINVTVSTADLADFGALSVGIFSPEALSTTGANNRGLLESSFDSRNGDREANQTLTLTITQPGIYYIAVGFIGDGNFNGSPAVTDLFEVDYNLVITGAKELAIGGLKSTGIINFPGNVLAVSNGRTLASSLTAERGDIGAILATGTILAGDEFGGSPDAIDAANGSIRSIQAGGNIGAQSGIIGQHYSPTLAAAGNVGLVQSGGFMLVNADVVDAIGGSYQLINCGTVLASNFTANGAIGTMRAQSVGITDFPDVWRVNADSRGTDGVIDLIDVTGDIQGIGSFGTLMTGGPQISTGPGGNVRYMEIAPTVDVFNDVFFGGNDDAVIHYAAGAAATITDDSGTPVTFYPTKARSNITGDLTATTTGTGTTTTSTGSGSSVVSSVTAGTLSALTYGIRDKGGVAIINLTELAGNIAVTTTSTSTGTTTTTGTGSTVVTSANDAPVSLSVITSARGTNGSIDIGTMNLVGAGEASTFDPNTQTFTTVAGTGFTLPEDMSVSMTGTSPINVWSLVGSQEAMLVDTNSAANTSTPALAGMGSVINATSGELVNFAAEDVVTLNAQTLGISQTHTASSVGGNVLFDQFPFVRQRTLIQVGGTLAGPASNSAAVLTGNANQAGNAQTIESRGGLGNILVNGTIGNVLANIDGVRTPRVVDGIVGPVYAATLQVVAPPPQYGDIINVNIGQGLGFSGTGDSATTGIFADNAIESVTNQGAGSDVRGDIAASLLGGGLVAPSVISPITGLPITTRDGTTRGVAINSINLTGGGSLINARIFVTASIDQVLQRTNSFIVADPNVGNVGNATAFDIGTINLSGNGGIIGTEIVAGGVGTINVPDGFGMINSDINGLNSDQIGSIVLGGYGLRSSIINGQNSVSSIKLTGTGKEIPVTAYTASVRQSETGLTTDSFSSQPLDTSNDLDRFLAVSKANPKRKGATEAGVIADTTITGTDRLGSLTAFRMIGHVSTATTVAQETAALLDPLPAMTLSFAQAIGKIQIKESTTRANITTGDLKAFDTGINIVSTNVNVTGNIADMTAGFFSGSTHINATGPDGTITYLKSTLGFNAAVNASVSIGEISVGTDLDSAILDTSGNFNELLVKHSILAGTNVRVANTLNILNVRHNILGGASVQAKKIGSQLIGGQVFGNVVITG